MKMISDNGWTWAAILLSSLSGAAGCGDRSKREGTNVTDKAPPADQGAPSTSAGAEPTNVVECGARTVPAGSDAGVAYELIDMTTKAVWVTPAFTAEEFAALEVPSTWAKNQPREGSVASLAELRSPNCNSEGEFTEQDMFGERFLHNVNIVSMNEPVDDRGLLMRNQVYKFQKITFAAGGPIAVLVSPEAKRYIRISRDAGRSTETPDLPAGWSIQHYELVKDLEITLANVVDNIRANNQDSFQGPLPAQLDLSQYSKTSKPG